MKSPCLIDDCPHPAARGCAGYCYGHYGRKRRKQAVDVPLRQWGDPKRTLFEAALALGDVGDDDEAYLRIIRRFWMAVERHKKASGHKVQRARQSGAHD